VSYQLSAIRSATGPQLPRTLAGFRYVARNNNVKSKEK
jgi:hypothetical protein